ncbi:MAG: Gfo/Idh/MocA family oxidoreductase [Pirellulales bacterium]
MPPQPDQYNRRHFTKTSLLAGSALSLGAAANAGAQDTPPPKKIAVGVIGCGSVSNAYLPVLKESPFVRLVSTCDIRPERARRQAERFGVPHHYPHIDQMLAGEPFDLLVNLTDMQEHERLNRQALRARRHVWSEKPIANSLPAGQELLRIATEAGLRLWGAPITVESPQFALMARQLAAGRLGRVAAAHAEYGHEGPGWSAFFYEKGGGSMPDLAVYNLTTLTGLLGPAKSVSAMLSIVTPQRTVSDKGKIEVEAEDNAMLLMDHGDCVLSHVQSGFNYFNPHGHDGSRETRYTVSLVGTHGFLGMIGYDWAPLGVELATKDQPELVRRLTDPGDYLWQRGAALAAECLSTGRELLVTPEHALHVLEVITAARESQRTGQRIELTSTFKWPVVT